MPRSNILCEIQSLVSPFGSSIQEIHSILHEKYEPSARKKWLEIGTRGDAGGDAGGTRGEHPLRVTEGKKVEAPGMSFPPPNFGRRFFLQSPEPLDPCPPPRKRRGKGKIFGNRLVSAASFGDGGFKIPRFVRGPPGRMPCRMGWRLRLNPCRLRVDFVESRRAQDSLTGTLRTIKMSRLTGLTRLLTRSKCVKLKRGRS